MSTGGGTRTHTTLRPLDFESLKWHFERLEFAMDLRRKSLSLKWISPSDVKSTL